MQIEFLRNGLQTACTSPQPSTTGGLAALETTCTIRQRGAVVMKQTLLAAAGKTSAYSLSYAGLAEAYDASQAEIRAVRESLRLADHPRQPGFHRQPAEHPPRPGRPEPVRQPRRHRLEQPATSAQPGLNPTSTRIKAQCYH